MVQVGPPDSCAIKPIGGDGNCFFHSISYIITGTELQHMDVRRVRLYPLTNTDKQTIAHKQTTYQLITQQLHITNYTILLDIMKVVVAIGFQKVFSSCCSARFI